MKTVLKGALLVLNGKYNTSDILIIDDKIAEISNNIDISDAEVINLEGKCIMPGLVDLHVHLREPGFEYKETIKSGSEAAKTAGYTDIFSMPNLNPAPDSIENLQKQLDIIQRDASINVHPYASITLGQKGAGELVDFEALAPYVKGFSDDGRGVQSDDLMREAMIRCKAVDRVIVAHCEVNELLKAGYIHQGEYAATHDHKGICSESEWKQIERDIKLVEETGCQYHVCHISTKESVELVRQAKAKGLPVTCETAPHYLILNDSDLQENGNFKMNPPIRSKEDQEALINGIIDGTIDVIATDHAPHSADEKSKGLKGSAFGIVGIEIAFPLMYTYFVKRGIISLTRLVELMSTNARHIMRLPQIEVGAPANLAIYDLEEKYNIDPETFISKGKSTPFIGYEVCGKCERVVF